jgi:hypothetical protein
MPPHLQAVHDARVDACEGLDLVKVTLGLPGRLHCCRERGVIAQHNQAAARITVAMHNLQGGHTTADDNFYVPYLLLAPG